MEIKLIDFNVIGDERGSLVALENNKEIPFEVKRIYYMWDIPAGHERGFHAHKNLKQLLICMSGECTVILDDGIERKEIRLDSPAKGLFIEGLIWREIKDFTKGSNLTVLASDFYTESDYIRDYKEFLNACKNNRD